MLVSAQVSNYFGGALNSGISKIRKSTASVSYSFGGGFSYVLWEYPEWYLKTGLEFQVLTSGVYEIPKYFDVPSEDAYTRVDMHFSQQEVFLPIMGFFPVFGNKNHSALLCAGMGVSYILSEGYSLEGYDRIRLTGSDIERHYKTGVLAGAGYQRRYSDYLYLNIFPVMHLDLKAIKPFTSFNLTIELVYGAY